MAWFIGQSAVMIVLAFLLGLVVGWLIWARRGSAALGASHARGASLASNASLTSGVSAAEIATLRERVAKCDATHGKTSPPAPAIAGAPPASTAADQVTVVVAPTVATETVSAPPHIPSPRSESTGVSATPLRERDPAPARDVDVSSVDTPGDVEPDDVEPDDVEPTDSVDPASDERADVEQADVEHADVQSAVVETADDQPVDTMEPGVKAPRSEPSHGDTNDTNDTNGAILDAATVSGVASLDRLDPVETEDRHDDLHDADDLDTDDLDPDALDVDALAAAETGSGDPHAGRSSQPTHPSRIGYNDGDDQTVADELAAVEAAAAQPSIDNLERVEGIGPKFAAALIAAGVRTYDQLADASEDQLRKAIKDAGYAFAPSIRTWARQARLLADGDEEGFEALLTRLIAGRDVAARVAAESTVPPTPQDVPPAPEDPAVPSTPEDPAVPSTPEDPAVPPAPEDPADTPDAAPVEPPAPVRPDDLARIEGIGPRFAGALVTAGIRTFGQLAGADEAALRRALTDSGLRFAPSLPTWAEQAQLLADGDEDGFAELTARLIAGRSSTDDLERIEGIGPKVATALRAAGVRTYRSLANCDDNKLRSTIETAGLTFVPSLTTWARQARLLADGDEEGFADLTRRLIAGRDEGRA